MATPSSRPLTSVRMGFAQPALQLSPLGQMIANCHAETKI